jgi:hypothetical protein
MEPAMKNYFNVKRTIENFKISCNISKNKFGIFFPAD